MINKDHKQQRSVLQAERMRNSPCNNARHNYITRRPIRRPSTASM